MSSYQQRARWRVVARRWEDGMVLSAVAAIVLWIAAWALPGHRLNVMALGATGLLLFCQWMRAYYTRWGF